MSERGVARGDRWLEKGSVGNLSLSIHCNTLIMVLWSHNEFRYHNGFMVLTLFDSLSTLNLVQMNQ